MSSPDVESSPATGRRRFSEAEVWVHGGFAALVLVAIVTAAFLSIDPLSIVVGRREELRQLHVAAGLLSPVPLMLGMLSASFRRDVGLLERFGPGDRRWLRSRRRRSLPVVRFNAGQKLNAAFTLGAVLVLLGTGLIMGSLLWSWPDDQRTGATFVHDWTAAGLSMAVIGHVYFVRRYGRGDAASPRAVS
ncbi:MAG: cytochrome b/b6 domain-containing protein [Actinomycetes bacterium]